MLAGLRLYGCVWMRALGAVQKGRARSVARYAVSGKAAAFVAGAKAWAVQADLWAGALRGQWRACLRDLSACSAAPQATQPWPHTFACAAPVRHVWSHACTPGLSTSAYRRSAHAEIGAQQTCRLPVNVREWV